MTSRIFSPIFAMIMIAIAIAFVAMPAAPANAQSVDKQVAVVAGDASFARIAALAAEHNHGAVVMAMAFGGQGLSQKNHRLAITTTEVRDQRSDVSNLALVPATSNAERYARLDFAGTVKSFVLKLPPDSPRQPKRFRFTPLTRLNGDGARDAVIH